MEEKTSYVVVHSFVYSLLKHLLSAYYVSGTVIDVRDIMRDLIRCFTYLLARMLNRCIVYDCFLPHGHLGTISAVLHVAPIVLPNHPASPAPLTRYKDIVIYSVQFYLCMNHS